MDTTVLFNNILSDLNLGTLTTLPQQVFGGFMHKMYCLETTIGKYAVKLLNPLVMERKDVFQNYQRAEQLEGILQDNGIPIVPALEIKGRKMQCMNNQYYYVFPWIEGKALDWNEIKREHCEVVGGLLAEIHSIEQRNEPFAREEINTDWAFYVHLADKTNSEINDTLKEYQGVLETAQKQFNSSLKNMPSVTCVCNGDMDSKNVLWVNGNPLIIDLECLDYGNPLWEMFQLALSWSGYVTCNIDFELLKAFIGSYAQVYHSDRECDIDLDLGIGLDFQVDWKVLYGSGFGWLEWLEYNVKRALMLECTDEGEQKMGISEVHNTIERIAYYHSIKEELLHALTSMR